MDAFAIRFKVNNDHGHTLRIFRLEVEVDGINVAAPDSSFDQGFFIWGNSPVSAPGSDYWIDGIPLPHQNTDDTCDRIVHQFLALHPGTGHSHRTQRHVSDDEPPSNSINVKIFPGYLKTEKWDKEVPSVPMPESSGEEKMMVVFFCTWKCADTRLYGDFRTQHRPLGVHPSTTVSELKSLIHDKLGIKTSEMALVAQHDLGPSTSDLRYDNATLGSYGIKPYSIIHNALVWKPERPRYVISYSNGDDSRFRRRNDSRFYLEGSTEDTLKLEVGPGGLIKQPFFQDDKTNPLFEWSSEPCHTQKILIVDPESHRNITGDLNPFIPVLYKKFNLERAGRVTTKAWRGTIHTTYTSHNGEEDEGDNREEAKKEAKKEDKTGTVSFGGNPTFVKSVAERQVHQPSPVPFREIDMALERQRQSVEHRGKSRPEQMHPANPSAELPDPKPSFLRRLLCC